MHRISCSHISFSFPSLSAHNLKNYLMMYSSFWNLSSFNRYLPMIPVIICPLQKIADISTGMVTNILIVKILPTIKVELRIRLGKVRGGYQTRACARRITYLPLSRAIGTHFTISSCEPPLKSMQCYEV
jgi:hypothetical protein